MRVLSRPSRSVLALFALVSQQACANLNGLSDLAVCGDDCPDTSTKADAQADAQEDARTDAQTDATLDAPIGQDVGEEASGSDGASETGDDALAAEGGSDAGTDTSAIPVDATLDTLDAFDAAPDTAVTDVSPDVPGDAGVVNNYVFVTSTTHAMPGSLGFADGICNNRAEAAGLPGKYVALLSSTPADSSAKARLGAARGWIRTDGRPFADRIDDLFAGHIIYNPVATTEYGNPSPQPFAWSGTGVAGDAVANMTCSDWTAPLATQQVVLAPTRGGPKTWVTPNSTTTCNNNALPFICFGVTNSAPLVVTRTLGKRAFVSARVPANLGVSGFDLLCRDEAVAAGLSGTYWAFISTKDTPASARLADGAVYVRVDGQRIGDKAKLAAGQFETGFWQTAGGAYVGDMGDTAFTGSASPDVRGTLETTCNDWKATAGSKVIEGNFSYLPWSWATGVATDNCAAQNRVYCIEQ